MRSRVPGKLILSGEHAVVHGAPALVMAVNAFAYADITPLQDPAVHLHAPPWGTRHRPLAELPQHLQAIRTRHRAFLAGTCPISAVAPDPMDFLFAAIAIAFEVNPPENGCAIQLHSDIPIGAGLGSSAAIALALLRALLPEADPHTLFEKALACEHFQHGQSSGIDVAACLQGGMLFASPRPLTPLTLQVAARPPLPFQIWQSGTPASTTGDCVAHVRKAFPSAHPIWSAFRTETLRLRTAMDAADADAWLLGIRNNHRLLSEIGVVPAAVQTQIARWETEGHAAKICGAGSITGDAAGILLVTGTPSPPVHPDWRQLHLDISASGACLLPAPTTPATTRTTH